MVKYSFKLFDLPQAVVEIVVVLDPDPLVLLLDVLGAHGGLPDGEGRGLALGKYRHHHALVTWGHLGINVSQS